MARTRVTDLTDVGQGLAAGCLAIGVVGVTSGKQAVEFAFGRAWRRWEYAPRFRFIRADIQRNDILHIIHKSERRRGGHIAAWSRGRWFEPYFREGQDVAAAAEVLPEWTDVPWPAWVQLAEAFVSELKDDEIVRERDD